jgi:DNA repair exonuclease SbcCD ATPase subunit
LIKTIAHLADVHIRKLHRFVEYREVFDKLYKQLKQIKPSLIYIGGDIVHGKLDTSPEETRMVSNFFLSLCKIAPTIVIPGNHDCNLNNKSREDTLSPIIDLVKKINPNIHYWKKSGVYTIDDTDFGVLSIFDINKEGKQVTTNLPDPKTMRAHKTIALFHGAVGTFLYDNGFQVTDENVSVDTFKGYELVLLGDIHKRQFLNKEKTIGYCGSTIQQNYTEEPEHGFLLWDIETKKSEFHQIENDYGFKVVDVIDGVIQNKMNYVPPKGNIKIKYWNTSLEQIKDIQIDLRKKYPKLKEVKAEKQDALSRIDGVGVNKIDIGDVRDVEYQNELITDYLANNIEGVDAETIKRICDINEMTNNSPEIYDGDITRNVDWKLKSFEFDNMFSYGKGNKIDFKKLNGIIGVVAPNHSGKSALFDAISYTIYDTCSRTIRAMEVLNKKKQKFKAKLNVEVNGESYWIEREGILKTRSSRKTGEVTKTCPVSVKFYMEDGDDIIDLSGAARFNSQYGSGTNDEIRKILGTFDDFILTSLSLQTNGMNFIDKKQAERKQILSQFMDIDIFDQLYDIAKSDSSEERVLLKQFRKKDSYVELATTEQKIIDLEVKDNDLSTQIDELTDKLFDLTDDKIALSRKLHTIGDKLDIEQLDYDKSSKTVNKKSIEKQLKEDKEYRETLRPLYNEYHTKLAELDEEKIESDYEEYKELIVDATQFDNDIKSILDQIKTNEELLEELKKYQYDEDCDYCINNGEEHINHKKNISDKLDELNAEYNKLKGSKILVNYAIEKIKDAEQNKQDFDIFSDELNQVTQDAYKIGGKITTQEEKIKTIDGDISSLEEKIKLYFDLEEKIKENEEISEKISDVTSSIGSETHKKQQLEKEYRIVSSNLSIARNNKQQIEQDIQNLVDVEQKILDYDVYLMAISKDGVPYDLISKTIPVIEASVNEVLESMMVGFSVKLEMEGKNIDTYICYGDDMWNLELSSGMERFVSSLAIRIGLINVSTLPRPNFLVIDEGFGSLDSDNIANMNGAFNYLKTQFDFVMIITHLDTIKDYMDTLIPINVNNGYSKVSFN